MTLWMPPSDHRDRSSVRRVRVSPDPSRKRHADPLGSPRGGRAHLAHLAHVDAMRVLTCVSVLVVHVVANTNPFDSVSANAVAMVLHYSREVFFVVSALVLVYAYRPRLRPDGSMADAGRIRRRRLESVALPYLVWGSCYAVVGLVAFMPPVQSLGEVPLILVKAVVNGTAWYHLYFLVVSIQFGLVLPWFLRMLHATRGRHGRLLAVSAVVQVATWTVYHHGLLPGGWMRPLTGEASLLAYQFWLVAGGVVAFNIDRFHRWVVTHPRTVLASVLVGAVAAEAVFALQVALGMFPERAADAATGDGRVGGGGAAGPVPAGGGADGRPVGPVDPSRVAERCSDVIRCLPGSFRPCWPCCWRWSASRMPGRCRQR